MSVALRVAIQTSNPRMSIRDVADRTGVGYEKLRNMAAGRTRPTPEVMDAVRRTLKLPPSWPNSAIAEAARERDGRIVSLAGTPLAPIPVVGEVAAGPGSTNVDPDQGVIYVPERLANIGSLGWQVEGLSMWPALQPGDVAIFREFHQPRRGLPFLLQSRDHELRVKIITFRDGEWTLESLNPKYPVEPLADHRLLGYLVGWYRAKASRETMDSDPEGLVLID